MADSRAKKPGNLWRANRFTAKKRNLFRGSLDQNLQGFSGRPGFRRSAFYKPDDDHKQIDHVHRNLRGLRQFTPGNSIQCPVQRAPFPLLASIMAR